MSKATKALLAGFAAAAIAAPLAQADVGKAPRDVYRLRDVGALRDVGRRHDVGRRSDVGRPSDVGRMNPWAWRSVLRSARHARPGDVQRLLPWGSRGIQTFGSTWSR